MDSVLGFSIVFSIVYKILIIFLNKNELIRLKHVFLSFYQSVCSAMYKINRKSSIMPLHATKPLKKNNFCVLEIGCTYTEAVP